AGKKTSTSEASTSTAAASSAGATAKSADAVESKGKVLTVCGNGLGTSLFLKNSLDEVLSDWGWAKLINVEATDTISAKGRAKEADFILTSGGIAATLGDVGVPVWGVKDFTSLSEIDAARRELYALYKHKVATLYRQTRQPMEYYPSGHFWTMKDLRCRRTLSVLLPRLVWPHWAKALAKF